MSFFADLHHLQTLSRSTPAPTGFLLESVLREIFEPSRQSVPAYLVFVEEVFYFAATPVEESVHFRNDASSSRKIFQAGSAARRR